IAACVLMPVGALVRLFAFAVAAFSLAVVRDMALGNISTLLLLPMVMAWRWMDRPLGSAALAIAMSLRPSLGLLLVWQGLRRRWHALAWTIASAIVLVVLTLPFVGIDGYLDYLDALRNLNTPSNAAAPPNGWQNHDLGEVAQSLGASADAMGLVRLGSIALGVGAMLLSLRRDREISYMVTLMASFIVVPILWDHYLVMLVIPAAFLAQRWRPIAILLPLLSWLPSLGFFAIVAAMLLPFLVRDAAPETPDASPEAVPGA
ncbi:MAG: glycosyltransferase 87 family protein, partial [Chloroflexota bacterium]|nr:glycosyltransferase 87 family protein [Chloroflexota bacterium]